MFFIEDIAQLIAHNFGASNLVVPKCECLVSKAMPYRPSTLFERQCHEAVIKNVLPFTAGLMQDCRILTDAG